MANALRLLCVHKCLCAAETEVCKFRHSVTRMFQTPVKHFYTARNVWKILKFIPLDIPCHICHYKHSDVNQNIHTHTHTHTHSGRHRNTEWEANTARAQQCIRGLSVKYPAFWISRKRGAWPWCNLAASQRRPYSVPSWTLSRGASQSAVRRRWLSLCIFWPSYSQISPLSTAILPLGNARSRREPNLGWGEGGGLTDLGNAKKAGKRAVEQAGVLLWWSWSDRSVIVNATVTQPTSSVNGVSLPND